jgi:hypothetical protein
MREDMYKVIVERPRRGKEGDATAARLRKDFDGTMRLGMRVGYGYRSLNENLAPLRRYLHAQIGRPWNKVFSEICAIWFSVEVDVLPEERLVDRVIDGNLHRKMTAESRYDVVLRKNVSRTVRAESRQQEYLYGSSSLYAVSKRQISAREIKAHCLR